MGTRVNYFLLDGAPDPDNNIAAVLYSNNRMDDYDPEQRFADLAKMSTGITELASRLLNECYPGTDLRVFTLDGTAGDNERVHLTYWASGSRPRFFSLPALTPPTMADVIQAVNSLNA